MPRTISRKGLGAFLEYRPEEKDSDDDDNDDDDDDDAAAEGLKKEDKEGWPVAEGCSQATPSSIKILAPRWPLSSPACLAIKSPTHSK